MEYRSGNLGEVLRGVRQQLAVPPKDATGAALWERLCLIIAEVLCLRSDMSVSIGGESLSAALVQDVYRMIGHEEAEYVIGQIEQAGEIRYWKSWARTALYNAVFEEEIDVAAFAQGFVKGARM